jgi:hypothetical protein
VLAAILVLFVALVYVPDVGRGFIKDDFGWIARARPALRSPATVFRADYSGTFYRPLVLLSFSVDYALHGLRARGYGISNIVIYLAIAAMLVLLFRELGLTSLAAGVGAFVWAINPHAVNMALLWISGRTSLIMTLCAVLAVLLFLRRHRTAGTVLLFCALLAKEDAILLPLVVVACLAVRHFDRRELISAAGAMLAAEAAYFFLRWNTQAISVATAPSYYRLTWHVPTILENSLHYLDRSATAAAIIALAAAVVYGALPASSRFSRSWSTDEWRRHYPMLLIAGLWFAAGLAITIRIPVRSSLYALFPSIGAALACGVLVDAVRSHEPSARRDIAVLVVCASILLLVPAYRARNARWVKAALVSEQTLRVIVEHLPALPEKGTLVLEDEPVRFANFQDAFGEAATEAMRLFTGRPLSARIVRHGDSAREADDVGRFRLVHGQVVPSF